jgi:hypothetical protein
VLHIEKQPIEPGRRHRPRDLDAARDADADAKRELTGIKLLARDVSDGGCHALLLELFPAGRELIEFSPGASGFRARIAP